MFIPPPGRGRRPAVIAFGEPIPLTEVQISELWQNINPGWNGVPRLKTLRHNHHTLAKAVASGRTLLECSQISGLSPTRISDLKNDPAFQELVNHYSDELTEVYVNVHERMAGLGVSVLEELQERFETEPDSFTKRELFEFFSLMADRSIATAKGGPKTENAAPGGNLALQINFVSPQGEVVEGVKPMVPASRNAPEPLQIDLTPANLKTTEKGDL